MKIWAVSLLSVELSPHVLTADPYDPGIRSLVRISGLRQNILSRALPPRPAINASPKAISGRTSYYQARLVFRFLPQLIPEYCTIHGFGPPSRFLGNSPWSWQARLASGLFAPIKFRPFKTRFPYAFAPEELRQIDAKNSLVRSAKSTPSP